MWVYPSPSCTVAAYNPSKLYRFPHLPAWNACVLSEMGVFSDSNTSTVIHIYYNLPVPPSPRLPGPLPGDVSPMDLRVFPLWYVFPVVLPSVSAVLPCYRGMKCVKTVIMQCLPLTAGSTGGTMDLCVGRCVQGSYRHWWGPYKGNFHAVLWCCVRFLELHVMNTSMSRLCVLWRIISLSQNHSLTTAYWILLCCCCQLLLMDL